MSDDLLQSDADKHRPLVSVVVPNYNYAEYLTQRLDSIFNQTEQSFEVILLDDASTDTSAEILLSYRNHPQVSHVVINEKNSGSTFAQWNRGASLARGEFLWFAEADDFSDITFLARLLSVLKDKTLSFAYCRSHIVDESGSIFDDCRTYFKYSESYWNADFISDGRREVLSFLYKGNPVPNASAVLVRKSSFDAVGGADESFKWAGDWYLWARLMVHGSHAYVSERLNFFRRHRRTMGSRHSYARLQLERLRVCDELKRSSHLSSREKASLSKLICWRTRRNAGNILYGLTPARYKSDPSIGLFIYEACRRDILFIPSMMGVLFAKWILRIFRR